MTLKILCSAIFIFMLALVGVFYPYNRGALYSALVIIYALTSGIAGYSASSFYQQLEGINWVSISSFFIVNTSFFLSVCNSEFLETAILQGYFDL